MSWWGPCPRPETRLGLAPAATPRNPMTWHPLVHLWMRSFHETHLVPRLHLNRNSIFLGLFTVYSEKVKWCPSLDQLLLRYSARLLRLISIRRFSSQLLYLQRADSLNTQQKSTVKQQQCPITDWGWSDNKELTWHVGEIFDVISLKQNYFTIMILFWGTVGEKYWLMKYLHQFVSLIRVFTQSHHGTFQHFLLHSSFLCESSESRSLCTASSWGQTGEHITVQQTVNRPSNLWQALDHCSDWINIFGID